jgi:hypothetical protein
MVCLFDGLAAYDIDNSSYIIDIVCLDQYMVVKVLF